MLLNEINYKRYMFHFNIKIDQGKYLRTCFINKNIIDSNLINNKYINTDKLYDLYNKIQNIQNIDIDKIVNKIYFIKYYENKFHLYKHETYYFKDFTLNKKNNSIFYDTNNLDIDSDYFKVFLKNIVNIINSVYGCNMTIHNIKPKFIEIIHNYIIQNFVFEDKNESYISLNNAIINIGMLKIFYNDKNVYYKNFCVRLY